MRKLRDIRKRLPTLSSVYGRARARFGAVGYPCKSKSIEQIFTQIFKTNLWGGTDSISGPGSSLQQTETIVKQLPILFRDYDISTILDIPCGDFHWMKNTDLSQVKYTGADIVEPLIQDNTRRHKQAGLRFTKLDIIHDRLPKVDLIFCRDCLVHFSLAEIFLALENICRSRARYLLTTTFTDRTENKDITTGDWRVLNLEAAPFMLPKPLRLINENCTENDGIYTDKSLGLWRIADIQRSLTLRHSSLNAAR